MIQEVKKRVKRVLVKKVTKISGRKSTVTPELIAKKAYELYEKRGCQHGYAEQDWLEAKRLLEEAK